MSHRAQHDHGQRDRSTHDRTMAERPREAHERAAHHPTAYAATPRHTEQNHRNAEVYAELIAAHRGDHRRGHQGHHGGHDQRRAQADWAHAAEEPPPHAAPAATPPVRQHPQQHQAQPPHQAPRPAPRAAAPGSGRPAHAAAAPKRQPFTFGYGRRQVRLGPVAFWTVVGTLTIMAGWSVVTATYFAFHDDVVARMVARQAEIEAAYEDRIAEMRSQVDRVTTRQLLDQEQFEQKLEQVIRRQSMIESRAGALGGIGNAGAAGAGSDVTGAIRAPGRNLPAEPATPKASPISDTVIFKTPPDRQARLESRQPPTTLAAASSRNVLPGIEGKIARLHGALDRLEGKQTASLASLEETYETKAKRIRGVLADLGLERAVPGGRAERDVGGPFVPYRLASVQPVFERQVQRVRLAREQAERLTRTLATVPIRKPVAGDVDFSSTFGVRLDPFLGRPAMHTGLDFRGPTGEAIRATANGTVTTAGWGGGYGKMVEIDHGNGLATRYGHMSEILVHQGQSVKIGQVIGRLGSTGRSTGPHLHYETRVSGEAVDPQKFLRAGLRIGAL